MSAPLSSSGEGAPLNGSAAALAALILAIFVVRLGVAAWLPLTEDEAYYRLWSQVPALGYFDHPPMIAWWIWLGRRLIGDTSLGVRVLPCLASAASSFLIFDLARHLQATRRQALVGVVWYNATLLVLAGAMLAVPDSPAALFWMACICCVARSRRGPFTLWWCAAGAMAGLAALSKYSGLFLGPGIGLWLLSTPDGRAALRRPAPWLALALAMSIFGLNVVWNADHQWLTFAKQFGRIAPHRFAPANLAQFILALVLLLNPFVAAFFIRGVWTAPTRARSSLLILTSLPFLAYLCFHALHDRVQAHWPAPLYGPLALFAALSAGAGSQSILWTRLRLGVPILALASGVAAIGLYLLPTLGVPLALDPGKPLRDWPGFVLKLNDLSSRQHTAWIGTTSYGLASELLDQKPLRTPTIQITERDRWHGLRPSGADTSQPGLVVDLARRVNLQSLQQCFGRVEPLGTLRRAAPGEHGLVYAVFRVGRPRRDLDRLGCP